MICLALRDLTICMKTKIYYYFFMKTGYFNIEFIFLRFKIQANINQNDVEKYMEKSQIFQNDF